KRLVVNEKLDQALAREARLAEENARIFKELNESLERQVATGEILAVINGSRFELSSVLDTITKTASRLCEAEFALVFTRRDDLYHLAAANNASAAFVQHAAENPIPPGRGSLIGRTALERKTVHLPDCLADPEYTYLAYQESGDYRSMLGVPLLRDNVPVGVIGMMRAAVKPFTEKQIQLVTTFAEQAVIAIENARLLSELHETLGRQTATAEVLQVINSSPGNLAPVFDAMLDKAMRLCDAAFGMIRTYDGEEFNTVSTRGIPAAFAEYLRT